MENSQLMKRTKQQKSRNQFLFWAVVVLLLAAVMRLFALLDLPPGLAQDEVLNADVVTFIRQGYHAIFFREGYGHEPLYHYWSVPFQILFGDNGLSIRLPAVYLGLLLVAATMRWTKREFGLVTALAAGIGLAISWWPIIFSRVGIRPIMEPLFLVVFAWFWPRRPWLAGLFLGLSVYTYTGARVVFLLPVLLFLYWFAAVRWVNVPRKKLHNWRLPKPQLAAIIVFLVALLLVLPLAYTLRLDPTLQQRVQQLEGPLQALLQGNIQPVLSSSLSTLGIFSFKGDPRWTYSMSGRPLFDPLTAVFFYGGLLLAILRFRKPAYAFALFWLIVALIPSAVTPQAPSTVRLVGAIPVVYLMPALGVSWLWHRFQQRGMNRKLVSALFVVAGLLVIIFSLNLFLTVRDGFVRWPSALETREKYQTVLREIAHDLQDSPSEGVVIADGFYRPITADTLRRDLARDVPVRWIQTGGDVAGAIVLPHEGDGRLYVPEYAAPDTQLMEAAGLASDPLYRSERKPSFAVYALPRNSEVPTFGAEVTFGDKITLVGYDTSMVQNQQSIQLFTVWRVDDSLPADLVSFVHWINEDGLLISQHDGLDAVPETLQQGDLVIQRHILPVAGSFPYGSSSFHIGFYSRGDGNRLLRSDEPNETLDRFVISQDAAFNKN